MHTYGFLMFSGGRERMHWEQMVKMVMKLKMKIKLRHGYVVLESQLLNFVLKRYLSTEMTLLD